MYVTASAFFLAGGLVACGIDRPKGEMQLGGHPVDVEAMTAAEVQQAVVVVDDEDGSRRYRAPTLRLVRSMDLTGGGGPVVPSRMGVVEVARAGYLIGKRAPGGETVRHFFVYRSDFVRGENRYAGITLVDGTTLSFRTTQSSSDVSEDMPLPSIQSVVAEVPADALRAAAADGLTVVLTLDNGHEIRARAPAPYVQGYLDAVGADRD